MPDSLLVNTPVASPLHPQANLPLLKGYLQAHGFKSRIVDSNIRFFRRFLGLPSGSGSELSLQQCYDNPLAILSYYAELEKKMWEKSRQYDGLALGLRYASLKHDRTRFAGVIAALTDRSANPFIEFYERFVAEEVYPTGVKIVGIAITFQDQIISAFTLADQLRRQLPGVRIVMGGQMITRCHASMMQHEQLRRHFDYLVLWDGEQGLLDIHRHVIRGEQVTWVNVIEAGTCRGTVDRKRQAPPPADIPLSDFTDINFNDYLFPGMLVPLQTTRGCYAACQFCAIPFGSNSYRMRAADDVIRDIEQIQQHTREKYGTPATLFKFMEDTSSPALLEEVARRIADRGLDVKWETFARLEKAFTAPGMMECLYRGGCRKIHWGLESNDPATLQNMDKRISASCSDEVLALAARAGILNFCFILVGFPGETDEARERMTRYIIDNRNIHTITIATFDLTRGAPMEQSFVADNPYGMTRQPAEEFQVRLPYLVKGENWKEKVVSAAHRMMRDVVRERPDIGFLTLFPDQIRSLYGDRFTNAWGWKFLERYGAENLAAMLADTEQYIAEYRERRDINPALLPEPLRREHFRTREDMAMIASAIAARKLYEQRRADQV